MKSDVIDVFSEINDLFNFEKNITKPSPIRGIKLEPYQQGVDKLCGIYALINATRLVIRPMRTSGSECTETYGCELACR